ncbi:MAG: aldose 1-epimerase family protein [Clostridiales bacterium]|nr:aldose 1-epimerase family protein [Clostridiales bacterium]
MRYVIENDILRAEIDSFGAELKSVRRKDNDREYMWYADKKYWGRTSPVLFPFVGSLKNKEYIYQGKHYPMGQHGFARDMEHTLTSQTDHEIWFELASTEETLAKYPFLFVLRIGYALDGADLKVMWKVENPAQQTMYFSIGAHPAFLCPVHGESSKAGYRLYFGGVDEIHHHGNTVDTGLAIKTEDIVIPLTDHRVSITEDFFDRCTYMIEGAQTGEVGLEDPEGKRIITMTFDTPLFAIWSPEGKNAPFLCIEPWYGRCDATDFDGTLEERDYTNVLKAGETFSAAYTIRYE